jgi:hypothetical protein
MAALMLVAIGCVVVASLIGGGHPGGDPGGVVLRMLSKVRQAVPPAATAVSDRVTPVEWLPGCGDGSRPGWESESVSISISFTDSAPSPSVVAVVDTVLTRQGWRRHATATGPGQGRLAHWTLRIGGQREAQAFAYPIPGGSPDWRLTATWRPAGPITEGCG